MGQTQRLRSLGRIEGMPRLTAGGQAQGQERDVLLEQNGQHRLSPPPPLSAIPPAQPDRRPWSRRQGPQALLQPLVGLRADRIGAAPEHRRSGRDA